MALVRLTKNRYFRFDEMIRDCVECDQQQLHNIRRKNQIVRKDNNTNIENSASVYISYHDHVTHTHFPQILCGRLCVQQPFPSET